MQQVPRSAALCVIARYVGRAVDGPLEGARGGDGVRGNRAHHNPARAQRVQAIARHDAVRARSGGDSNEDGQGWPSELARRLLRRSNEGATRLRRAGVASAVTAVGVRGLHGCVHDGHCMRLAHAGLSRGEAERRWPGPAVHYGQPDAPGGAFCSARTATLTARRRCPPRTSTMPPVSLFRDGCVRTRPAMR